MTYIKKEDRRILALSDKKFVIPNSFKKFINKKIKTHNLIIKSRNNHCICTNCNHNFDSKAKINEVIRCPYCKQKLLIKTNRIQSYTFKDNLQLLDKIESKYILRTFELYTSYNNYKTHSDVIEFMRTIINDNDIKEYVTNQVNNHMGYMYIAHYQDFTNWRCRNYRWSYRDVIGMVSPYNIKAIIKDIPSLKYSQLDQFVKKSDYIDFVQYFQYKARNPTFELLVKLKLYNLAIDVDMLNAGKNFQEVIGISKEYYPFMLHHKITYNQLKVLRIIKKQDIKLINNLTNFSSLEELSKYVDIETAYRKVLRINKNHKNEYLDYLDTCNKLGYDMKDNNILYPQNMIKEHNRVQDLLVLVENQENDKLIQKRLPELNQYIYQNKKYIIFPAKSVMSLIDESKQLNHCVRNYSLKYASAGCDIYFMRKLKEQEKSLITIEVQNNKVIQSRIKFNGSPTDEQTKFIKKWEQRKLLSNYSHLRKEEKNG